MEQQTITYSVDGLIKDWKESKHYFHKWIVKYRFGKGGNISTTMVEGAPNE